MNQKTRLVIFSVAVVLTFTTWPLLTKAQELHNDLQGVWKARVVEVLESDKRLIPGTDVMTIYQTLKIEILEGEKRGQIITIENDLMEFKTGDRLFFNYLMTVDGQELYSVNEPNRTIPLVTFVALFVVAILIFGRFDGLRSLASLVISFVVIIYLMLPLLLRGVSPVPVSILSAGIILAIAMYITHGFNRTTHAAFSGTVITVIVVGLLAWFGVVWAKLSGFAADEAIYLNLNSGGTLNLSGILLAGIIIGVLGILDDIAITQAAAVRELKATAPHLSRREIYTRAFAIGKEHVGALVNTLALAYAGAALPLLLLLIQIGENFGLMLNREIFATEIIRTIVGSIGLILAVPITTLIAVFIIKPNESNNQSNHHHYH